jgi:uroporphyrin-3 C-methyltransferase
MKARVDRKRSLLGRRGIWIMALLLLIGIGVQQLLSVRFWEALDHESGQIATVDGRLTALEAAMADQTRLREDVRQMQQALQQEHTLLGLDLAEQQIDAGWQIWQGTGDPKQLIVALQNAQRSLEHQSGAAMQALRLAVGRDLVVLKSKQVLDLRSAVESMDVVIASIDKLPLIQDRRVPVDVTTTSGMASSDANATTLLERGRQIAMAIAQDVWQSIRGMIRVQRLDRAEAGLIAPEQKVFLQQGLRLLLLDARHALVMRNVAVYQQTLAQARAWIEKYADGTDALIKADLATLQRLSTLNIDPAALSLDDTRKALVNARAVLTGEPLVDDAAAAQEPPKALESAKGDAQ